MLDYTALRNGLVVTAFWKAKPDEAEAVATQKRFLDHYLKGHDNDWSATPRVRLECEGLTTDRMCVTKRTGR